MSDFPCPRCRDRSTKTLDSRPVEGRDSRRRRKACNVCGHRWTTYEINASEFTQIRNAYNAALAELQQILQGFRFGEDS